jgi:hypothetical protein
MMSIRDMNDSETAAHLREWVKERRGAFSWPTDGCGYEQHMRFVEHRNKNWRGGTSDEYVSFILAYADAITEAAK